MKKRLLFLLLFFAISGTFYVTLADDKPHVKISTIIYALTSDDNLKNLTAAITQQIETNLSQEGYKVSFLIRSNNPLSYDESFGIDVPSTANVNIWIAQYSFVQFSAFPYSAPITNLSPILEKKYVRDSYVNFSSDNNQLDIETSASLATGLGLYSVGGCEQMQKYFQSVLNSIGKPSDNLQVSLLKSIYFYQGNCNLVANDIPQAISLYQQSLLYDGNLLGETGLLVGSAINLAWAYVQIGKSQDAVDLMTNLVNDIETLGEGFSANPMWVNRYWQRAEIYNLIGHYDDALQDLNSTLEIRSVAGTLKAHFYFMRGQTHLLLYQWDNVLADYNKALEIDPTYADAYFYRGVFKYSVLQTGASLYPEALTDFQHYLELSPDGEHAADATRYATDIQTQLNALNN